MTPAPERILSPLAESLHRAALLLGLREVQAHSSRIVAMTDVAPGERVPSARIVTIPTEDNDPEEIPRMVDEGTKRLARLSQFDALSLRSIVENGFSDVFRVRLTEAATGSVPLAHLPNLVTALSRMMRDLAKASFDELEIRKSPVDYKTRNGFLDHLHAGQTERGSYVVTVLSSLETFPDVSRSLNLTMTRQLVDLSKRVDAVRDQSVDAETAAWSSRSLTGILGDTCAQLGRLIENARSGIDVHFAPSPLMQTELAQRYRGAPFARSTADTLYEFAEILQPRQDAPTFVLLKGVVTDAHQEPQQGREDTYFKIRGKVLEGRSRGELRTIQVHVPREQLPTVLEAFKGKYPLMVRGELDSSTSHRWSIQQPERIDPLPDENWEDVLPATRKRRTETRPTTATRMIREEGPLFMVRQLVAMGLLDSPLTRQEIDDLIEEREGFAFGASALSGAITRAIDAGLIHKRHKQGNTYEYWRFGVDPDAE